MSTDHWPAQAEIDEGSAQGQNDFLRALWERKFLLLLLVSVGLAGGYFKYHKTPPEYSSTARLHVQQTVPLQLDSRLVSPADPLDTHAAIIRSPRIVQSAVDDELLGKTSTLNATTAVQTIVGRLSVERSDPTVEILELKYRGSNPSECKEVLDAVIKSYINYLAESQQSQARQAIQLITQAKDELLEDLSDREDVYAGFRDSSQLLWSGVEARNIHTQRLAEIENSRSQLLIARSQTEAQLNAVQDAIERGGSREAILLMIDQMKSEEVASAATDSNPASLAGQLLPLLLEEQILLDKVAAGHPKVREVQKRIEMTRSFLETASGETPDRDLRLRPDIVSVYVESLQQELKTQQVQLDRLNTLFQEQEQLAKTMAVDENRDRALREDIDRKKRLFDTVLDQLQTVELTKDAPTVTAEVVDPPGIGRLLEAKLASSLGLGGALGLIAGAALVFLLEMADKSFRGPDDVSRVLDAPVVGHIPIMDVKKNLARAGESQVEGSVAVYHRPGSQLSEAYRAVRATVLLGLKDNRQVLQITSPSPGDGKTTLAANLAVSIANSGKRCLLIDADFRRPRIDKLFGLTREQGVSTVVSAGLDPADAVQEGPVAGLEIMTAGPRSENPSELLLSPKFVELLEFARQKYDLVIIDSPPLLAVSDPSTVAALVDSVLLVLHVNKRARPHAVRAREILDLVGARIAGVVVNAIGDAAGHEFGTGTRGYRSGSYRGYDSGYGYGYHYGYRYGRYYGYGGKEKSYYDESSNGHERAEKREVAAVEERV